METLKICNCNGREVWRRDLESRRRAGLPLYKSKLGPSFPPHDEDGYACCVFCGGIDNKRYGREGRQQLTQCPECGKWFKGVRKYLRINYECPECD